MAREKPILLLFLGLGLAAPGYAQPVYFGNQATANNNIFQPLGAPGQFIGARFTAQQTAMVGEIQLYVAGVSGPVRFQATLQADSGGLPNGVVLGGPVTGTPVAGWNDLVLTPGANVAAGTAYHIVLQDIGPAAPFGFSYSINFTLFSNSWDGYYPLSQTYDPNLALDFFSGTGWMTSAEKPVFLLNYGGSWDGNPYIGIQWGTALASTSLLGERFNVTQNLAVTSVGAYLNEQVPLGLMVPPADNLYWAVRDLSSGTVRASGTLVVSAPVTVRGWVDVPAGFNLPPGTYRLELSSPGSSASGSTGIYQADLEGPASITGIYPGLTYGGTAAYAELSSDGGLTWSPNDNRSDDLPFRFGVALPTPTPTPAVTPTPPPDCGRMTVSQNLFRPSVGPVTMILDARCLPPDRPLMIYNSAGEHIQTLLPPAAAGGLVVLTWDGTNQRGEACASGIYILRLETPEAVVTRKVALVR